ncbi:MAG: hypothetical protein ABS75_25595 [Pelagibacterium sp. SCN 63-23]|nr:MAG: hypothetical protein ABS75_25595 [Pelagibacterium sp. SCN 63-23]
MGLLAPLAALLGLETESLVARARSTALAYGVIAVFLVTALVFLLAAGFMALAEVIGPIMAALAMGGAFLLLALAVYLGAQIGRSRKHKQLAERRRASETGAFLTSAAITALPMVARSPALLRLGVPAAILAFFLLRRSDDQDD